MLVLLPPSETKRPGGSGAPFAADRLALPELAPVRERVCEALVRLSADPAEAARVLGLSERQRGEIQTNAALRTAPTMSAVDRYTGVLFDALDAGALDAPARRWLGRHVLVHSAPFGPVGALDPLPAYRLGASASLPHLPPLRRVWADAVTSALAAHDAPFILDLRSEAYAALGPLPAGTPATYVRIVSTGPDGLTRALNHFNKRTKGLLVRELALSRPGVRSIRGLLSWLRERGHRVDVAEGEWLLHAPAAR